MRRWFEIDASKRGARYFDKKYGSGAKGYKKGSEDYFDMDSFVNGGETPYVNPRTGLDYTIITNPISGHRNSWADVLVPFRNWFFII